MADFEHALFMLLLLVGVFTARPPKKKLTLVLIFLGVGLAVLPPFVRLTIPWDFILSLTIPILFWQNARHWLHARWRVSWLELILWLSTILGLAGALMITGYLTWGSAVLFGIVAASMLWRAIESEGNFSQLSQLGPLTLVFLLTEIAPAVETPDRYVGGLFSGAAIGIGMALLAIYLSQRLLPAARGWVAIIQVYLAFWLAGAIGVSEVAAALISIAAYSELALRRGMDRDEISLPAPLNWWPLFAILLGLFVFLGWQAHQPLSSGLVSEAILGMLVGLIVAALGRWLKVPVFLGPDSIWQAALRTGLFLFASFLLWPRNSLGELLPLAVALGIAVITIILSATVLSATLGLQDETA